MLLRGGPNLAGRKKIEAAPAVIDEVATRLGRTPADYNLESYPRLYVLWCAAHGQTPGDMTFG